MKRAGVIFLIVLILIGTSVRFLSIAKDYSAEETDFVKPAIAILTTGHPLFYQEEQKEYLVSGLSHPPMYIYSLAILFRLFGINEIVARLPNIIFSLLTAVLIFFFCYKLIDNKNKTILGILAAALFLVNYYVFSSSILIDIDVFSMFFIFLFIFSTLVYYKEYKKGYALIAIFALFFSLFNRYPIAILTYLIIGIYLLFKHRNKLFSFFIIGLTGGSFFLLIWSFYSLILEPGTFFSFISHNAQLGSEQFSNAKIYFFSFILNISQFCRLVTFPAVILIISSMLYFLKRKELEIKILIITSLGILILFFLAPRPAFGYPRYFLSAFPGLFILVSYLILENIQKFKIDLKKIILILLAFFGSLILLLTFAPNPTFYQSNGLILSTNLSDFIINFLCMIPILFLFFVKKNERYLMFISILLVIFLSYNLYFDSQLVFNNSHIKETGEYLEANTSPQDILICPKAVGYYTNRRFFVNDNSKPLVNNLNLEYFKEYLIKSVENPQMNNEFFWEPGFFGGIHPPRPEQEKLEASKYVVLYHLGANLTPEKKIGNFYIYLLDK